MPAYIYYHNFEEHTLHVTHPEEYEEELQRSLDEYFAVERQYFEEKQQHTEEQEKLKTITKKGQQLVFNFMRE